MWSARPEATVNPPDDGKVNPPTETNLNSPNVDPSRADENSPPENEQNPASSNENVHSVEIEGRERVVVSRTSDLPRTTCTCTVECASGERDTDAWTGVPIAALVEAADFPGGTTHLRAEADDFVAEIPIRAALDGLLAFDREVGDRTGLPRLIADEVPGERLVKRARRIAAVELTPEDDPLVG